MAKGAWGFRSQIAETLELPKDVVMDVPKITIIGSMQLNIENHRGIVHYDSSSVKINTNSGVYRITGSNLMIKNIASDEIVVTGDIENIDIMN